MTLPSWDILILAIAAIFVGFSIVALHSRIIGSLLSAYAAYLVTMYWSQPLYGLLTGGRAIFGFNLSLKVQSYIIATGMFLALWLLFTTFVAFSRRVRMPVWEVTIHAIFTIAFVFSSVLTFMNDAQKQAITGSSKIAFYLAQYHNLLLLIPVALMLFSAVRHGEDLK